MSHLWVLPRHLPLEQSLSFAHFFPVAHLGHPDWVPPPQSVSLSNPPATPSLHNAGVGVVVGTNVGAAVGVGVGKKAGMPLGVSVGFGVGA